MVLTAVEVRGSMASVSRTRLLGLKGSLTRLQESSARNFIVMTVNDKHIWTGYQDYKRTATELYTLCYVVTNLFFCQCQLPH